MGQISKSKVGFIRNIFARDKQKSELAVSSNDLLSAAQQGGGVNIDAGGIGNISSSLALDDRLLYRYSEYEAMDEYGDIACLSGFSLVFTMTDGWRTILSLAKEGKPFSVLSYDRDSRTLVPAQCLGAVKTGNKGHGKPMVKVTFDIQTSIWCTDDHLFLTEDDKWVKAGELKQGDGLMPVSLKINALRYGIVNKGDYYKVASVEKIDISEDVYDLTVPEYKNFICNGVIVHNSALDIYADDATQTDSQTGHSVWVKAKDAQVQTELEDMLWKRINIEEEIWSITRTLSQYGNDLEEIIVGDQGVVDLRYLPPATVRRVESNKNDLMGFVQSYSGDISISPSEFKKLTTRTGIELNQKKDIAVYEDWRVTHMRLRSKHRNALYGYPVTESARWVWKRLMLLEDAVLVYKLCLHGDTNIWTSDGYKKIRDIEEGDEVYSYTTEDKLKKTKVVYKKQNGQDMLYRIKSSHRELYANATHPILVETIIHNGSGSSLGRRMDYVEVQDLNPDIHRLVTPSKDNELSEDIELIFPKINQKARLSSKAIADGVKMEVGVRRLQDNCGVQAHLVKRFFAGEYEIVSHTAEKLMRENGTSLDYLEYRDNWGGAKDVSLPSVVTLDFARWFGFMIGDGFVSIRPFKKNGRTHLVREFGFSAGDKEDINQKYKALFESFFGEVKFTHDKRSKHACVGKYSINSKGGCEFMLLNGYIPGAHEKRVPSWVFRSSIEIRMAFLDGLADADGQRTDGNVSTERNRVKSPKVVLEMCNAALVEDVRELVMQVGYIVTEFKEIFKEGGREILNNGFPLKDRFSFSCTWSEFRQPMTEQLLEVSEVEVDDIWDIGVEANEHNFVANGIVVHNTRSPSRYAFYIDVGKLPRQEAERAVQEVMQRIKKKKFVDPRTGKLNLKFNPLPVAHDSLIPLLDGRTIPISQMAQEHNDGKSHWVYSINRETGNIVPGEVEWVGKTRAKSTALKVTFDDGSWAKMAPDHPVMRRDRRYAMAQDLSVGDSVMPFYRRVSDKNHGDSLHGYEMVYDPEETIYRYTHRIISKELGLHESGQVIHHKSLDRRNNNPDQLEGMDGREHRRMHSLMGHSGGRAVAKLRKEDKELDERIVSACRKNIIGYNKSDTKRKKTSELNRQYNTKKHIIAYNNSEQHVVDNDIRRKGKIAFWSNEEKAKKAKENMKIKFTKAFVEGVCELIENNPDISSYKLAFEINLTGLVEKLKEGNTRNIKRVHRDMIRGMHKEMGCETFSEFKESVLCPDNHKVVSIEEVEPCDHFCMTVKNWHNFALVSQGGGKKPGWSSGVFVKNSMDEDFFLAMRDGRESTRVESLMGPSYQQVEDVQYFLHKLYAAIKVPRAYMGYDENMPSKATLCLSGDTVIPLLDGSNPTIEELANRKQPFIVYSVNEDGDIVPGLAHDARVTRRQADTLDVEFDNGRVLTCTLDHPVMMRDGTYKEAQHLKPFDSVMPLYRRVSSGYNEAGSLVQYEQFYNPGNNSWRYVGRLILNLLSDSSVGKYLLLNPDDLDAEDQVALMRESALSFYAGLELEGDVLSSSPSTLVHKTQTEDFLPGDNHLVVDVRVGLTVDTYDLTVDKYHNFATGSGVIVHNSQEDVRFARTVLRVQREVRNGLKKVGRVDLAAKNIDPASVEFEIMMTTPSSIFELGQMEVRRAQADLATMMERHVSQQWLLSNVYGMADQDIESITGQKKAENKAAAEAGIGNESRDNSLGRMKGVISERELLSGNKEDEKRMEDAVLKAMNNPRSKIGNQLRETGMLLRDIAHSVGKR